MDDLSSFMVHGRDAIHLMISMNGNCVKCIEYNVLYVPNFSYNLLSVGVMERAENSVYFDEGKCLIENNVIIIAQGQRIKVLYILQTISKAAEAIDQVVQNHSLRLWHEGLSHVHVNCI